MQTRRARATYPSAIAALGAVTMVGLSALAAFAGAPPDAATLIACALIAVGALVQIPYGFGGRQVTIDLGAVTILVALAVAGPDLLLPVVGYAAAALCQLVRRRPAMRVLFNAAAHSLSILAVLPVIAVTRSGPMRLAGLAVAIVAVEALTSLLTSIAIARSSELPAAELIVRHLREVAAHTAIGAALGTGIAAAVADPALWPVPVITASLLGSGLWWLAHRTTEGDALASLVRAAAPVQAHDPVRALEEVAERGQQLFAAEQVHLSVLSPTGQGWWTCTVAAGQPIEVRPVAHRPVPVLGPNVVTVDLTGVRGEDSAAALGQVSLALGARPRLTRNERHVVDLFAGSASAAWGRVLDHQDLLTEERERQAETQRRLHAQTHEPLTGLPNRTHLDSNVDLALAQGRSVALLLVRMSRFREVNEILGHQSGDSLLREVAHRLRASVRASDLVSRVDGAAFAVALVDVPAEHVLRVARQIHSRLRRAMTIDGLSVPVEATIGLAQGPVDASTAGGLLRCAEVASAAASRASVPTLVYDSSQEQGSAQDLKLLTELADAVERDELVLHYQPKVDLRTAEVLGVEALVRWAHPTHGLLPPSAFITHLEHSALIVPVTLHLVEKALIDSKGWPEGEAGGPTVAVNLGARCLLDPGLPDALGTLCRRHAIEPGRLMLEITETMAVSPLPVAQQVLDGLREAGFGLSVDDFGTGYSSLTFLHDNRVAELKIDRSFVSDVVTSTSCRAIVGAAVAMAHDLGIKAVAEGVETEEQLQTLMALGVDEAQGYLLARPMPAHALEGHLAASPTDDHVMAALGRAAVRQAAGLPAAC